MVTSSVSRRTFLRHGSLGATALVMGGGALLLTACDPAELAAPDASGVMLPPGFRARVIATTGQVVGSTGHVWHAEPDGGGCFALPDGGWSYVSNCESDPGGVGYIRFDRDGRIVDAGAALELGRSKENCAGGVMPWGTWLSCEERSSGRVFECDPVGASVAVERRAMGRFRHEAAAADVANRVVYMTEDEPDGGLYRFVPDAWGNLSSGVLEILTQSSGSLAWVAVPEPDGGSVSTRHQVANTKRFDGGEGCAMSGDTLLFTTKGDNRVWSYDPATDALSVMYDEAVHRGHLEGVDNLLTSDEGVAYVAEDGGDMQVVLVRPDGATFPVLQLPDVGGSEITGLAFDPSGSRLYFSSQRNPGRTYEVTGRWNTYAFPGTLSL